VLSHETPDIAGGVCERVIDRNEYRQAANARGLIRELDEGPADMSRVLKRQQKQANLAQAPEVTPAEARKRNGLRCSTPIKAMVAYEAHISPAVRSLSANEIT
jgi:hypothetical protein